jgi:hypothetical protein
MRQFSLLAVAVAVLVLAAGCGTNPTKTNTVKGEGGKELSLTPPMGTSIKQGETKSVTVKVDRKNLDEPITVEISDLPEGVTAKETTKKLEKGEKEITFTLEAKPDAKLEKGHKVKVKASAGGLTAGPETFTVDVRQKT